MSVAEASPNISTSSPTRTTAHSSASPRASVSSPWSKAASASATTRCRRCWRSTWSTTCCCPSISAASSGLGWLQQHWYGGKQGQALASAIFGNYTALVYLTPILGGIVADKWLGRRGALVAGRADHVARPFPDGVPAGASCSRWLCLIVGVGLFKGNIASQVGELYGPNDNRRAMAFQIFYIAIQLSVIAAPLISGTAGEKLGWHYGFGIAGVVMVLGLLVYLRRRPYLPHRQARQATRPPAEKVQELRAGRRAAHLRARAAGPGPGRLAAAQPADQQRLPRLGRPALRPDHSPASACRRPG